MAKGKNNRLPVQPKREIKIDQGNVGSLTIQLLNSINENLIKLIKLAEEK